MLSNLFFEDQSKCRSIEAKLLRIDGTEVHLAEGQTVLPRARPDRRQHQRHPKPVDPGRLKIERRDERNAFWICGRYYEDSYKKIELLSKNNSSLFFLLTCFTNFLNKNVIAIIRHLLAR